MTEIDNINQKVKLKSLGTNIDYLGLYFLLKKQFKSSYLFESLVLPKQQDRYFTIGFDPIAVISAKNGKFAVETKNSKQEIPTDNPYREIKKYLPTIPDSNPYHGGLVGYFSYESANYFESSLNLSEPSDFSMFELGLYLDGLIYDNVTKELTYFTHGVDRSDILTGLIEQLNQQNISELKCELVEGNYNISKDDFCLKVRETLKEIRAGNSFQVEVGLKKKYKILGEKFAIYSELRSTNPSPYMYYLKFNDKQLFGSSPEIVVSLRSGKILTTPAAGTIERGENDTNDQAKAKKLSNDPKEIAEHSMLVDLHRNDISRVSQLGSVKVDQLMHLMKFSYVQHLVSDISGVIKPENDAFDLLASIMPCGVLTGAPKIETMKIIQKNELEPRGPYGGGVGRFSFNGDCVFTMPIRSLFFNGDEGYNQACAGIVFDSEPEKEYSEVIAKLNGMEQSIRKATK